MARRGEGDYKGAAKSHTLASLAFQDIGDKARSVISLLDAGIDLASSLDNNVDDIEEAKRILKTAIDSTPSVEGTDIALLQRVISKECEGRIALASLLWSSKDKAAAETQLAEACTRLDQLQIDSDAREALRVKSGRMPDPKIEKLSYTIDDNLGAGVSCSRFKNEKFLSESLLWPESLQQKVLKMNKMNNS
jgi:voltage-gated potassium channel Kch